MPLFEITVSPASRHVFLIRADSAQTAEDFAVDVFNEDSDLDVETMEVLDETPYPGFHGDWADYDLTEGK